MINVRQPEKTKSNGAASFAVQAFDPSQKYTGTELVGKRHEPTPPVVSAPKKTKKIAIMGTAPQWMLAPFDDPEWEIWGIFGVVGCGKRLDRLYEIHDKNLIEPMAAADPKKKYWEFAASLGDKYITKDEYAQCPNARRFDFASKVKKYGDYFASSASWLVAEAIDEGATHIGLWGINMSSDSEYAHQKPSLSYLLGWARAQGITIEVPASSEILSLTHQYGLDTEPRFVTTLKQKKLEIDQQMAGHRQNMTAAQMQICNAEGAMALVKWIEQNYSGG